VPADWTDRGRPAECHALGYEQLVELIDSGRRSSRPGFGIMHDPPGRGSPVSCRP